MCDQLLHFSLDVLVTGEVCSYYHYVYLFRSSPTTKSMLLMLTHLFRTLPKEYVTCGNAGTGTIHSACGRGFTGITSTAASEGHLLHAPAVAFCSGLTLTLAGVVVLVVCRRHRVVAG